MTDWTKVKITERNFRILLEVFQKPGYFLQCRAKNPIGRSILTHYVTFDSDGMLHISIMQYVSLTANGEDSEQKHYAIVLRNTLNDNIGFDPNINKVTIRMDIVHYYKASSLLKQEVIKYLDEHSKKGSSNISHTGATKTEMETQLALLLRSMVAFSMSTDKILSVKVGKMSLASGTQ